MSTSDGNIVFLHIPKTAGQSVHAFLERIVGKSAVAPARVNAGLLKMTREEIRSYRLISGHLDWALLDCVLEPKFVFTVLRDPLERILSFYHYLRAEAAKLDPARLALPQHAGMRAALELSCDDYFCAGPPHLRTFLDNHYSNFYAFYFAGRSYDGRQKIMSQRAVDENFNDIRVVEMALSNLRTLTRVYRVDELNQLEIDVTTFVRNSNLLIPSGASLSTHQSGLADMRVNVGDRLSTSQRIDTMRKFGATKRTFDRLEDMTRLDNEIWRNFA